jgi:hypothetical protein
MSERRENSVLFSLKELRNIEDGRVRKEKEEAEARVEAERAAKAAAERAVREAEERRIREEDERVRRIEEEKESRVREEQMRLGEAERRARVEGEMRLHEERMRLEVQIKHDKSPVKAILGVAGVLVIIGAGLGYKMYSDHEAAMAAANQKLAAAQEAAAAEKKELEARLAANQKDFDRQMASAKTDAEKAQARADYERRKAEIASGKTSHTATKSAAASKDEKFDTQKYRKINKAEVPDDPLAGIK